MSRDVLDFSFPVGKLRSLHKLVLPSEERRDSTVNVENLGFMVPWFVKFTTR